MFILCTTWKDNERVFSFLISLLDNQLIAYALANTSPTKAPRPISWEDYCQAGTPRSMYYFPFIKHAYLDKDSGLMGQLTEVWLTLSGFYTLRGLICTEGGGHREVVFIYAVFWRVSITAVWFGSNRACRYTPQESAPIRCQNTAMRKQT